MKPTMYGYLENGSIRRKIPRGLFKNTEWDVPPEIDPNNNSELHLKCKRSSEIANYLNSEFPPECFHVKTENVSEWVAEHSGNNIPGVYRRLNKDNQNETWVDNYIVFQIKEKFSDVLIFTKPLAKEQREEKGSAGTISRAEFDDVLERLRIQEARIAKLFKELCIEEGASENARIEKTPG